MGIHPFQISDLNANLFQNSALNRNGGPLDSEIQVVQDNINGQCSRYLKLLAVWANPNLGGSVTSPGNAGSWGQTTGAGDGTSLSTIWRPEGGYFMRGLWFTNTQIPPNGAGFRDGYVGSFVSGLIYSDYGHDPNNPGAVDYEPIYGHGQAVFPMTASIATQWLDSTSSPADGTDQILNNSSAYSRTPYMPPSYMIFHIDSAGSNTLASGNVKFHFEQRPTIRAAGFSDLNGINGNVPSWSGMSIPNQFGATYPFPSDPLRNGSSLGSAASDNFHEYYQVTGVRKLNSRGLSFHLAKVFDNSATAYAYPYEEDGITLGPGIVITSNNIQPPYTYVNDQQEYVWAGGRDVGAQITQVGISSNVVTITANNTFSMNQIVLITGLTHASFLNGALVTVTSANSSTFTFNFTHANYGPTAEQIGVAVFHPDFRVRNAATFTINEEYYGMVMDTKCTIWSSHASMIPLLFFDLADTWTASTAKRIAGVSVVPAYINATNVLSYQIFFLAEDGSLARYDFTQTNGVLELAGSGSFSFASSAPSPAITGEAYGAMQARSTTSTITNVQVATNVLTVQCSNSFETGEVVNLQGLTTATFLNNQTVTVASATGSQFTANYTHANYGPASDTGTAVGYSLWAIYGTMSPDPRLTQTNTNTARIGVLRYLIGSGAWLAAQYSPVTGRHNGRSLGEMIVARDTKLYIMCEDVQVSGSFTISNAFTQTFPQGPFNVNWQVMAVDPTVPTAVVWNASKINGTSPIQYGPNQGPNNSVQSDTSGGNFWFFNINAFLHDPGVGTILIQPNWTAGSNNPSSPGDALQLLNVSGSTSALSNSNLTALAASTLFAGLTSSDGFITNVTNPRYDPVTFIHAKDFATSSDRMVAFVHFIASPDFTTFPLYLAPPSYNWASPATTLTLTPLNSYGSNPPTINSFQKDSWSIGDINPPYGTFEQRYGWLYPVQLRDNYLHVVRIASGGVDGLPSSGPSSTYGRAASQSTGFLPTYWKWTGSAWVMADNWNDAFANPYTVPNANVAVPLPYGLNVTFGPLGTTSYTGGEFHTFNLCWGNTKFARNMRQSWAQFAGQTFTNTETRTIASQNAISLNFIDTDVGTSAWTAPTSITPQTATLTTAAAGWTTNVVWNKLDTANAPFDATPLTLVWTPSNQFQPGSLIVPTAQAANVTGSNPYSWTSGGFTYVASSSGDNSGNLAWFGFAGSPDAWWEASTTPPGPWLQIDLGSGNAQTVQSYGFRPAWLEGNDTSGEFVPTGWVLVGANTPTGNPNNTNSNGWTTIDTRTGVTPSRGYAFNVATPGSYRYYALFINTTTSFVPAFGMFRLSNQPLTNTCNFVDLAFFGYGTTNTNSSYNYRWLRQQNMSRGHAFYTSTTASPVFPTNYTQIFPVWRSHMGYVYSFPRQTAITGLAITVQHGYNANTIEANSLWTNNQTAFGPFFLMDYGVTQTVLNSARLGIISAPAGTAAAASFDPNCLGIATDVPNISLDGANPSLISPYSNLENAAVYGFWDFAPVPSLQYKVHPFYGFTFFQDAGPDNTESNLTNTNMVINYQWGRRI